MLNGSMIQRVVCLSGLAVGAFAGASAASDEFDAPASYYSSVSGTGASLKSDLFIAMLSGHIERRYGDFRSSAAIHDADPNTPGNILVCYERFSIPGGWDSGSTWNREHVWPQSLQPGSASNSTRGNLGDPHALRPAFPSTNSSRGNKPFGFAFSTGSNGSLGSFYFPGDMDKGDMARSLMYSDTRYGPVNGISLVNGTPVGNQMGQLDSLVAWHYVDTPDTFERRRNHAIFSQDLNPVYYTNNRNAYVDHPEFVWSVYVDQENDSQLRVAAAGVDGSSSVDLDVNTIVGIAPDPVSFTITKSGNDGTYYSVESSSMLGSSVSGRHNAFAIGSGGMSVGVDVTVDPSAVLTSGVFMESVVVDNLDVTTMGGPGVGANDADDVVNVDVNVYEMFDASFEDMADTGTLVVDLGPIELGGGDGVVMIDVYNIGSGSLVAPFDLGVLLSSGDTSVITIDLSGSTLVGPGVPGVIEASIDDASLGTFSATYTLGAEASAAVFGSIGVSFEPLTLELTGSVVESVCAADLDGSGTLNFGDVTAFLTLYGMGDLAADLDGSGSLNFGDVTAFLTAYGNGCP